VDLAVGCTYKYLNGGPGSPAFLYVRQDLQKQLSQPLWGWFAAGNPFEFDLEFTPANNISRFRVGTPAMLSMKALEPAIELFLEADMEQIRAKSIQQTEYLIFLAEEWLTPLGFTIGTPRQPEIRGSHVSLRHADAYRINRAMIESPPPDVKVIPDFRAPDNIRMGIAPLYTKFTEIYLALDRMRTIVKDRIYEQFSSERLGVT
jgi:kynureninase